MKCYHLDFTDVKNQRPETIQSLSLLGSGSLTLITSLLALQLQALVATILMF